MNTYLRSLWRCRDGFDAWRLYQAMPAARSRSTAPESAAPARAEKVELAAGSRVLVRAIRPGDHDAMQRAFKRLTPGQIRSRFFHTLTELPAAVAAAMCDIDPESTVSLVATDLDGAEIRGEARVHIDTVTESAEFAIAIDPAFTGKGLGRALLSRLIEECRARQLDEIWGETQSDNAGMLALARDLGFDLQPESEDAALVRMTLPLHASQTPRQLSNAA
jgi:acetyltransferase